MKLINGTALTPVQRKYVLAAFVHRWTHENARQTYDGKCPGCQQINGGRFPAVTGPLGNRKVWEREEWHAYHRPLETDEQWLASHAFWFKDNGDVAHSRRYAVQILRTEV